MGSAKTSEADQVRDSLPSWLPFMAQGLLPLAHRSEEPGDDVLSPHLQVQDDIKMTYQETPALLLPSSFLAERVTPFSQ
jgi:hypothetical protein